MQVPLFDTRPQHEDLQQQLRAAFERVVTHGAFILGAEVEQFERACCTSLSVTHAVGVSNGSDALYLALKALDIGPGDEVITTPFTFIATAEAIVRAGATPVFADVRPDDFCLCPASASRQVTGRTRAILYVHLFGNAASVLEHAALCRARGLHLIEDACQAWGAQSDGRPAGTFGAIGCFSFFPTKPLGGLGDGGLCVTNDADVAARLRRLRVHSTCEDQGSSAVGGNFRLDALQAAFLSAKLPHVERFRLARQAIAENYRETLQRYPRVVVPAAQASGTTSAWSLYTVAIRSGRDGLRRHLAEAGIESRVYYPSLLSEDRVLSTRCRSGELSQARRATTEVLSLPIYFGLDAERQAYVTNCIASWCERGDAAKHA